MKTVKINGTDYKDFSEKKHKQKHTLKENTHCFECAYCEGAQQ